jgi:hypothetical protein
MAVTLTQTDKTRSWKEQETKISSFVSGLGASAEIQAACVVKISDSPSEVWTTLFFYNDP